MNPSTMISDDTRILRVKRKRTEEPAAELLLLPTAPSKKAAFKLVNSQDNVDLEAKMDGVIYAELKSENQNHENGIILSVLGSNQMNPRDAGFYARFHRDLRAALSENGENENGNDDEYVWDLYLLAAEDMTTSVDCRNAVLIQDEDGQLRMDHLTEEEELGGDSDSNAEDYWANEYPDEDEFGDDYDSDYGDEYNSDDEDEW